MHRLAEMSARSLRRQIEQVNGSCREQKPGHREAASAKTVHRPEGVRKPRDLIRTKRAGFPWVEVRSAEIEFYVGTEETGNSCQPTVRRGLGKSKNFTVSRRRNNTCAEQAHAAVKSALSESVVGAFDTIPGMLHKKSIVCGE